MDSMKWAASLLLTGLLLLASGTANARFVSVDPVQANANNGQNFNRYNYGNNNPYRFTDPDGRQVMEAPPEEEGGRDDELFRDLVAPTLVPLSPAELAEPTPSLIPDPMQEMHDRVMSSEDGIFNGSNSETGSYTNYHESGMTYDGKGSEARAARSARRVERETGDRHVRTEHSRAANSREAFKQESRRLDSHGGARNPNNHNRIESPGKRMRQQDGELPPPPPKPKDHS
jgi:hypothetical protein